MFSGQKGKKIKGEIEASNLYEARNRLALKNDIAKITTDLSFRDLDKLWNEIVFNYLDTKRADMSFVQKRVEEMNGFIPNTMVG